MVDAADAMTVVDAADAADAADAGIPSLGLVGQWLCSGNTNDTSGSGNNGTATGALTFTADRHGTTSAACAFNGSNASVQIPSSTSLGVTTTWSLSAWVNPNSFSALAGIASKYQTINAKGIAVRLANTSPFNGIDVNEGSYITDAATGFLTASTWTHVGVTVNGLMVNIFINGSLAYASTAGYATQTNSDPLALGVDYANRFFNGAIDDVRLYDRVLSPAEIEALFLAP
jgi:hypothetical protein